MLLQKKIKTLEDISKTLGISCHISTLRYLVALDVPRYAPDVVELLSSNMSNVQPALLLLIKKGVVKRKYSPLYVNNGESKPRYLYSLTSSGKSVLRKLSSIL